MPEVNCLQVEHLADFVSAPEDDPRRLHTNNCPRCQALLAEYIGFMAAGEGEEVLSTAECARLDQALAGELAGTTEEAGEPGKVSRLPSVTKRNPRVSPWWVAVPAMAAVVALFFILPSGRMESPDQFIMRGEVAPDTLLVVHPIMVDEEGRLVLSWDAINGADSYSVEMIAADLSLLTVVSAGKASLLVLEPETGNALEVRRFWRVIGFKEGDPVIRSGLREFPSERQGE